MLDHEWGRGARKGPKVLDHEGVVGGRAVAAGRSHGVGGPASRGGGRRVGGPGGRGSEARAMGWVSW